MEEVVCGCKLGWLVGVSAVEGALAWGHCLLPLTHDEARTDGRTDLNVDLRARVEVAHDGRLKCLLHLWSGRECAGQETKRAQRMRRGTGHVGGGG